jgi:hypothetical protein
MPLALEMSGSHEFDPSRLGLLASELGDRVAVLATGSVPAGVSALLRLAGVQIPPTAIASAKIEAVRRVPEAAALLDFCISDLFFDARHRTGADRL